MPVSPWPPAIVTRRQRPVARWSGAPSPDARHLYRGGTSAPCRRPRGRLTGRLSWYEDTDAQDGLRGWSAFELAKQGLHAEPTQFARGGGDDSERGIACGPILQRRQERHD